jgi:hypothetical protein
MSLVILFAGNVFKTSISSYRIASAQAEIMQKFRAITDQLNNDFRGLRKDAPMFIWFQLDTSDANNRLDQIMFFADGDFQSTRTYAFNGTSIVPATSGSPVVSNLARIYYGQARSPVALKAADRVLSRRQHLYIANPDSGNQYAQFPLNTGGILTINPGQNDSFEHDTNSLSQWQAAAQNGTNVDNIITGCFNNTYPRVDPGDANTLHLLMAQKVGSFSVQWSYYYTDATTGYQYVYWWPSIDPDGNPATPDSDFGPMTGMNSNPFGFYFNTTDGALPAPTTSNWFLYSGANGVYYPNPPNPLDKPAFPQALKFTFTLYDSRGVFKDGQTFTHIVYLGD